MKSWIKWVIGIGVAAGLVKGAQLATKLKDATGKVKAYFINWRVTRLSQGFLHMQFDYKVINNSDFSVTIENMYVTIQAMVNGKFEDVMVSGKIDNKITLPAKNSKDVKAITLLFNVQSIASLISIFAKTGQCKAITTFEYKGFEVSNEQIIQSGEMLDKLKGVAGGIFSKIGIQL